MGGSTKGFSGNLPMTGFTEQRGEKIELP